MSPWHLVPQHFSMIGHALGEKKYHFPLLSWKKNDEGESCKSSHNASFVRENLHLYSINAKGFLHSSICRFSCLSWQFAWRTDPLTELLSGRSAVNFNQSVRGTRKTLSGIFPCSLASDINTECMALSINLQIIHPGN